MRHRPLRPCHGGAALLSAMLMVSLVATLAATALWQQWRQVQVESAERSRQQAAWLLTGALDWARLILREDARTSVTDHLAEPWAVPLQEARLSSFLAADPGDSDQGAEVFLSGQISDLQARLNVSNLVDGKQISRPALASFGKLFGLLGLAPAELALLSDKLLLASAGQAADAPLIPERVEQLAWLGLSEASIKLLRPYITVLPERTPVNLNTASAQVIYASVPALDLDTANRLVLERGRGHFRALADAGQAFAVLPGQFSLATRFFEVRGRLRLQQTVLQERSLVRRDANQVTTLWRERAVVGEAQVGKQAGSLQ